MNTLDHKLSMLSSLHRALQKSKGTIPRYSELKDMTFEIMLEVWAQNGIRFWYDSEEMNDDQ